MQHYRFTLLLVMLLSMMVFSPLSLLIETRVFPVLAPLITMLLFSGLLLSAVWAVANSRWMLYVIGALTVTEIIVHGVNLGIENEQLLLAQHVLGAALLGLTLALLLRDLFIRDSVDFETIAASLCGYLMLGIFWAKSFLILEILQPQSFSLSLTDVVIIEQGTGSPPYANDHMATALYFSYVTLTTLGFGDITPASISARMLCTVEAITGQLYLAVLVARLVGLHIAGKAQQQPPDGGSV